MTSRIQAENWMRWLRLASACWAVLIVHKMRGHLESAQPKPEHPPTGAETLIYVVDDEAMLLELAAVILEPLGYQIKTFRDPASALDAFVAARPRPSLIITDYAMHSMTGMGLMEACRKLEPNQKFLLVSGTVGPEIYHNSSVKPDQFLEKPYYARQLIDMVKSMLVH